MDISKELREQLLVYQKNEITEYHIYKMLARAVKSPENRRILAEIADDELQHYQVWRIYTQQDVKPDKLNIWKYYWISRIFGFTFGIKLMEKGEEGAQDTRRRVAPGELVPEQAEAPAVESVLKTLADARLVTTGGGHVLPVLNAVEGSGDEGPVLSGSEGTVEVAHEALIREWPLLRGWRYVQASWHGIFKRQGASRIWPSEVETSVTGDMAWVVCTENVDASGAGDAVGVVIEVQATNIFRREGGEWRMIHHHASPQPQRPITGPGNLRPSISHN